METETIFLANIAIPNALKAIGIVTGAWALLVIVFSCIAYFPGHPNFSPFTVYLSDIGDTHGWPQIIFNSGTLMSVPMRYLVIVLLAMRLAQMDANPSLLVAVLVVGFLSTAGTALMTATPFSVSPVVHKSGIGLYFLGVVFLQVIFFLVEWPLPGVPKILPVLSLCMIALYIVFLGLMILYGRGTVTRETPMIWEWSAVVMSIVWMMAQSVLLGAA